MTHPLSASDKLAQTLTDILSRLARLERGRSAVQLSRTSMHDTGIPVFDALGEFRQLIGKQGDGRFAVTYAAGDAPPRPTPPVVSARQLAIVVGWDGTFEDEKPSDFARLDVHMHTDPGFIPDGTNVYGSLFSEGAVVIPADNETHYVKTVAVSLADVPSVPTDAVEVVALPASQIASEYVYAGGISVNQLTGGTLNAQVLIANTMRTAESGARTEVGPPGITNFGPDDSPSILLPNDPEATAKFKGDVEAGGLTVTGMAAFRSTGNEISKGAELVLQAATTAPQSSPTASFTWPHTLMSEGMNCYGLVWHNGEFWTATRRVEDGVRKGIDLVSQSGLITYLDIWQEPVGGFTRIGDKWFVLSETSSGSLIFHRHSDDGTTENFIGWSTTSWPEDEMPAIGTDGTYVLLAQFYPADKRFGVFRYSAADFTYHDGGFTNVGNAFSGPVVGVERGTFDLGDTHTVILSRDDAFFRPFNASLTYDPSKAWEVPPMVPPGGFAWDGTRFAAIESSSVDPNKIWLHSTHQNFSGTGATYHVTSTWRNSAGGYETTMGAVGSFTMKKRAQVTLTTPTIPGTGNPDDPDSMAVYLSNTTKDRTALWLQTLPAVGANSVTLGDDIVFAGINPPTVNNFPGATPGRITNADGTLVISGDGSIQAVSIDGHGPWVPLPLINGWVHRNLTGEAGKFYVPSYRKTADGHVELIGTCYKSGGANSGTAIAGPLPAEFIPQSENGIAVTQNTAVAINLHISQAGYLIVTSNTAISTTVGLAGKIFLSGPQP